MTVNILLCDTFPGFLPDFIPSYEGMLTKLFDCISPDVDYRVFRAMDGELPEADPAGGLYLIPGCNRGAYEPVPWIKQLLDWIVVANERKVFLTGICFGHQCIAQALGGRVEKAPVGWGTALRESRVVDADGLRYFPDGHMRLLYNHHDQVVELPPEARLVATSQFCPIESFRIGTHVLTFQGHPEYVPEYSRHLLLNHAADEPIEVRQRGLESLNGTAHEGLAAARWMLEMASGKA